MSSQWSLSRWGLRGAKADDAPGSAANGAAAETVASDAISADAISADAVNAPDGNDAESSPPESSAPVTNETREESPQMEPTEAPNSAEMSSEAAPATGANASNGQLTTTEEDGPAFLAKLARAMHTTAARERSRIADDVERRRAAHVQAVRDRAASEVERIRALAGEDMKTIEAWAEGEAKRVRLEREQREKALNDDLEVSLREHRGIIDREIADAEAAIAAYRTEAEAFFADLDRESDPVLIARQAALHPVFPTLPATTRPAAQTSGPAVVGVMGVPSAGAPAVPGVGLLGSRPLLIGESDASGSGRDESRQPVGVVAGSNGPATGTGDSPLDSLLSPRSDR